MIKKGGGNDEASSEYQRQREIEDAILVTKAVVSVGSIFVLKNNLVGKRGAVMTKRAGYIKDTKSRGC